MPDAPEIAELCVCGHDGTWHEHYRDGTDCGICGPLLCPRFRHRHPVISPELRRLLTVALGVPVVVAFGVLVGVHLGGVVLALLFIAVAAVVLLTRPNGDR